MPGETTSKPTDAYEFDDDELQLESDNSAEHQLGNVAERSTTTEYYEDESASNDTIHQVSPVADENLEEINTEEQQEVRRSVVEETERKVNLSMSAGNLPEELLEEIFFRVPARYLFGLRLICKSWNALITNPQFASAHFDHNNTHQILFTAYCHLLCRKSLSSFCLNQEPDSLFNITCTRPPRERLDNLKNPNFREFFKYCLFAGSINGIICLSSSFYRCVAFWNPSINHWKVISCPPVRIADKIAYTSISLAFDALTNDYKIIRLVPLHTNSLPKSRIEIYSSNQDSWNIDTTISFSTTRLNSSVIVKGVPYWSRNYLEKGDCHRYQSNFIAAIDPHTGLFKKIKYPSFIKKNSFTNTRHVLLGIKCILLPPTLLKNKNMCILRCFEDAGKTVVVGWDKDDRSSFLYDPKTDSLCHSIGMGAFRPKWGECYHHADSLFSINGMEPILEEEDNATVYSVFTALSARDKKHTTVA
ncbi:hypothetical protein POM88_033558 [Heracleum sosnowskyi]|uniref:F-box domain-containing protein n=1 Tax=Heracleum sosnowskyi TaxID=360622 RepID=A0AAD8I4H2_9APIA|nr:hypothetical protein POM88_033558 [Heracleum sosnowskyi]